MAFPLLPILLSVPLIFAAPLLILHERHSFAISLVSSAVVLLLVLVCSYLGLSQGFQSLAFSAQYLPSIGVSFSLGITGYSDMLLIMSAVVLLSVSIASRSFIKESPRIFGLLFLLAQVSALGLFLSGSLYLFYLFWVLGDCAMFFMMYIFGGFERRYAAIKFLVYSTIASSLLLVGIFILYLGSPVPTFEISGLASASASMPPITSMLATLMLLAAFFIKMPIFPFHNWLPDAVAEQPTPGGMMLVGIFQKFGSYGLLITLPMLALPPSYAKYAAVLLGFSAIYGAIVIVKEHDLRRIVAQLGMISVALASIGIVSQNAIGQSGAVYLLLCQGLAISLLLLISGAIDESFSTVLTERLRGIAKNMPFLAYSFLFGVLSFVGVPFLGMFTGYFLSFSGAFEAFGTIGVLPLATLAVAGAFVFLVIEKCLLSSSKAIEPFSNPRRAVYYSIAFLIVSVIILGALPAILLAPFSI